MLKLILVGALAVPMAAAGVVAGTGLAVVDVREGGRDGHRIVVPVPLVLAQAAAAFVPQQHARLRMGPEAERILPMTREALLALAEAADGELVRVEERDQLVSVRKQGRFLHVDVRERDQRVRVRLPLDAALSLLPDAGDRIRLSDAVSALRRSRFTELVEVEGSDGERVRVSIY